MSAPESPVPSTLAARVTYFMMARYRWVLALAAVLLVVTGFRTALTYGSLKSELEELLPRSAPSVTALAELRQRLPGLRFVFLEIDGASAGQRVEARAGTHFFSSSLVDSQFATLEPPVGEPGVLRLDALAPLSTLQQQASAWLAASQESA